jgi:DNA-binding NarL/FixJ family response regulator
VRQGLRALLEGIPEIDVVDEVGDTDTAVAHVRALQPDLLVLDLSMPKAGGLSAIRMIKSEPSSTAIVVLTRFQDAAFVRDALEAGASGYVLKQSPFSELQYAIAQVMRGERYVDRHLPQEGPSDGARVSRGITQRELEVLRRAALGQSNKEIAAALAIAVKTVEVHKTQGMRKLALRDRRELVRYATIHGWLREP